MDTFGEGGGTLWQATQQISIFLVEEEYLPCKIYRARLQSFGSALPLDLFRISGMSF
jgi:hypothetical protein